MKQLTLVILFMFTLSNSLIGSDVNSLFKKGNDEYAKGAYSAALSSYKAIEMQGYSSAQLYFNLGNAYYKLDSLAASILYYERALLLEPADEDILFNLDLANQKTADRVDKMPILFIKDWWQKLGSRLSLQGWSFLTITTFWVSMLSLALYVIARKRINKIIYFSGFALLLIAGIGTYAIASSQNNRINNEKEGIIFSATVTATSAPGTGKDLFVLHEGTKVRILDKEESAVKIRLGNGNVGWIPAKAIKAI